MVDPKQNAINQSLRVASLLITIESAEQRTERAKEEMAALEQPNNLLARLNSLGDSELSHSERRMPGILKEISEMLDGLARGVKTPLFIQLQKIQSHNAKSESYAALKDIACASALHRMSLDKDITRYKICKDLSTATGIHEKTFSRILPINSQKAILAYGQTERGYRTIELIDEAREWCFTEGIKSSLLESKVTAHLNQLFSERCTDYKTEEYRAKLLKLDGMTDDERFKYIQRFGTNPSKWE